jgi:translation initiation factor 2D
VSGTIYTGSHPEEEQRILWVKYDERLYPTVYTLWHNAALIPLLHTQSAVIGKIQGGADLMTPGLARGPPFPEKAKRGSIVAIASSDSPTIPMAVGVCEIDIGALQNVQGTKGHAVRIVHWSGDELWSWSAHGKPGGNPPSSLEGWLPKEPMKDSITERTEQLHLEDEEEDDDNDVGGVSLHEGASNNANVVQASTDTKSIPPDAPVEVVEDRELTTKEIDAAFEKAFLYGVRHHMDTNKGQNNFGLSFPLSQSFVMSNLVQPFLPAYTSTQASSLQIKKSSWKNIKKFIKALDKKQIIKCKDRDGNEVVILDIDFNDVHIRDFVPYRLPKKETAAGTSLGRGEKATVATDSSDPSVGQKLKRVELYRPREKLSAVFEAAQADAGIYFTGVEVRSAVTKYIEEENLISEKNKRLVNLNPVLANAVFDGSSPLDKEVVAKGAVPRDALIDRILQGCSSFHVIIRNDEQSSTKPKAGVPPKINIVLETRGGNKTVTRVSGLETYFIPPQPLADELKKVCAGSTSIEMLKGSSPKTPIMEVMVQGPQKDAVIRLLEKRGVNKQWVEVTDKLKSKKKG